MKKISILIPTYNEELNVVPMAEAVIGEFENNLDEYDYEIVFIDNCSTDGTRDLLGELCEKNFKIKAIFNAKNFGQLRSPFYGLLQTSGDCTILLCADFQDPVELLPTFVREWEKGYKIVHGVKTKSKENGLVYLLRSIYYKTIKSMSSVEQIEHFTGFGLYDREFIEILKNVSDPEPWLRGIVAELGYKRKAIPYQQAKRRAGKSKNNIRILYDLAMLSFTSYTKTGIRVASIFGFVVSFLSILVGLGYTVAKLLFWDDIPLGVAPLIFGVFFLGGIQIFFIGLIGEYILNMNTRLINRPLVIEERRINFE
jgi:glycosyltransferase involved in cell wall biosynthesis